MQSRRHVLQQLAVLAAGLQSQSQAQAQRSASPLVRRIGFLVGEVPSMVAAFEDELRLLGRANPYRIEVDRRITRSNTDDTRVYAAELGDLPLELIVAASLPQALAVREANPRMPMVIATCPGMISNGFARTLERPGGLYTGMDELPTGLTARRLSLLKLAAPVITRIGLLSTTPGVGGHETQLAEAEQAAASLGVRVMVQRATSRAGIESGLARLAADGMDGLMTFQGALSLFNRDLIVAFARERRLPAMYQSATFTEAGGLMAWSPDQDEQFRVAARMTDRILDGTRPADVPIRHPDRYYLTLNRSAAREIGLELPSSLLAQADFVLP